MIFPDSTTDLPDTSTILIDDPQAIFAEVPYKEEKTWGEYWKDWKDLPHYQISKMEDKIMDEMKTLDNPIEEKQKVADY